MTGFKTFLFGSITVLLSTVVAFLFLNLFINIFALQLFSQEYFPRGSHNYVGRFYRMLYAHAHDGKLEEWTAILGDSYSEGAGDAYRAGERKYSVAHFLRDQEPENFLIFGRAGFGNISAVHEYVIASREMSDAWFLPDIGSPNQIFFLFYEGNDLTDNLRHLRFRKSENVDLHPFVIDEILKPADYRRKINHYLPLVLPVYLGSKNLVQAAFGRTREGEGTPIESATIVNRFRMQGGGLGSQIIEVAEPLQNAAVELNQDELDLAIDIFFECVDFLATTYSADKLIIVYIPSPATIYRWQDSIRIQTESDLASKSATLRENNARSEHIRHRLATYMASKYIRFIDSTDAFRSASESRVLHGPTDWKHFNARGYALLAEVIAELRGP